MKNTWLLIIIIGLIIGIAYVSKNKIGKIYNPVKTQTETFSAPLDNNVIYQIKNDPIKGDYLTDFQGWTLYVNDNDKGNGEFFGSKSRVPYTLGSRKHIKLPANLTVITRSDGTKRIKQFAWKGMPLYGYNTDNKPGNITGELGDWHIVKP